QGREHAAPARPHGRCGARRRRTALSRQGRHHVGGGIPCRLSGLAHGRGAARPGHHVRLLAPRDLGGRMSKILILGATSAIAQAYARRRAAQGASFILAGRNPERLAANAADLVACGAKAAEVFPTDLAAIESIDDSLRAIKARFGAPDEVFLAYGTLGEQTAAEQDLAQARVLMDTNYTSAALWVLGLIRDKPAASRLTIVGIGSVAGDRGRAKNYIYGSTKAALDRFLEGLTHKHDG